MDRTATAMLEAGPLAGMPGAKALPVAASAAVGEWDATDFVRVITRRAMPAAGMARVNAVLDPPGHPGVRVLPALDRHRRHEAACAPVLLG
jgi:hypothetical protein